MTPPVVAIICCETEALEDEGAGHDFDCQGPGAPVLPADRKLRRRGQHRGTGGARNGEEPA